MKFIEILNFSNDSYVELPTLQGVSQAFTLEGTSFYFATVWCIIVNDI